MEGIGTEAFAMAPFCPVRRTANSETPICSLAPSHHGVARAARPSSAEAFLRAVESERVARCEGEEMLSDRRRQRNVMRETCKL